MDFIGKFVSYVCLMLFIAFAVSTMWVWFMVPLGVVPIGYANALGLTFMTRLLVGNFRNNNADKEIPFASRVLQGFINVGVIFLFGYITFLFM